MPARLPIAIISPHSALAAPPEVAGRLALTETQIFNEADVYVDLIYDYRDRVHTWLSFPYARAIVDMNRSREAAKERPGDGIVKRQTSYGAPAYFAGHEPDAAFEEKLITTYWQPWHDQLQAIAHDPSIKLVVDCHSMAAIGPTTYGDPNQVRPRAAICNMGNLDGELFSPAEPLTASPALTRFFAERLAAHLGDAPTLAPTGPAAAMNTPYRGGWDIAGHARAGQPWFMLEINRALYVGRQDSASLPTPPHLAYIADLRERLWRAISEVVAGL